MRNMCNFIDCAVEHFFVRLRGLRETGKFANKLQRRRANLVVCRRRLEVMQGLNVSAHERILQAVLRFRQCELCNWSAPQQRKMRPKSYGLTARAIVEFGERIQNHELEKLSVYHDRL